VKILVLCVGKLKDEAERTIVARYVERFGPLAAGLGFPALTIAELPESRAVSAGERKAAEAAELRRRIPDGSRILALDGRGRDLSSEAFAARLASWRDDGARGAALLIGGPDGLHESLTAAADLVLSLGRLTLPHGLARCVLAEQLYRAVTILARHPYHRA
jgi:23S rRNA (pseudouridine1915-N3)-methyltransferase